MSLFTKREHSLIFPALKKSSFLKSMWLLNFLILWSWNILYLFNISMMLNKWIIQWFWVDVTTKAQFFASEMRRFCNYQQNLTNLRSGLTKNLHLLILCSLNTLINCCEQYLQQAFHYHPFSNLKHDSQTPTILFKPKDAFFKKYFFFKFPSRFPF